MSEKETQSELQNFCLESRRKRESRLSCKTNAVPKGANGYPPVAFPIEANRGDVRERMRD